MDPLSLGAEAAGLLQEALAYLNLSSGTPDPKFQRALNRLFQLVEQTADPRTDTLPQLYQLLSQGLQQLSGGTSGASADGFGNIQQAQQVLKLTFESVLPDYRQYHRDLLFHHTDETLFRPFFLARVFERVLSELTQSDEAPPTSPQIIARLNDYIGHRPVAVLRTAQKIEPYPHEWVRPIPLYLRDAGACWGRYRELIDELIAQLRSTSPTILDEAYFDLDHLDELAVDPRAYDFDHPVNKRPNYHFGQWDPHHIDNSGFYRRFVLQEVTLEALWRRVKEAGETSRAERLVEAATVLAGTLLMASIISGRGPETHDSSTTLSNLVPRIARFRDRFYEDRINQIGGVHGDRLRAEATTLRQAFGGARQHLNQQLARLRAVQLQHVHLAQLFARMGYPEAAKRQANIVPVASARLLCGITGRITTAHLAMDRGQLDQAGALAPKIEELLHRAIECGALVDPWNILGFQGNFSLFPAMENSVRDHRVDVLMHLMTQILSLYARLCGEAAAAGNPDLERQISEQLQRLAPWWDQFASLEVSGIEGVSGREALESAAHVAAALGARRAAGVAAGDIVFWRKHVTQFNSPKAYALVVAALLDKYDFVAAMALLMQWLSQVEQVPLADGEYSFHDLAVRWLLDLWQHEPQPETAEVAAEATTIANLSTEQRWALTTKFFDYLEANAEEFWDVPRFEVGATDKDDLGDDTDDDDEQDVFGAAYEEMSYRDSTRDGVEGETLDGSNSTTEFELDFEVNRLGRRLAFLVTLARLWKIAAPHAMEQTTEPAASAARDARLLDWFERAVHNRHRLDGLLTSVTEFGLLPPTGTHDSLVEYDRRRRVKDTLLGRIVATAVEMIDASRRVLAARTNQELDADQQPTEAYRALAAWERLAVGGLRCLLRGDVDGMRLEFPLLRQELEAETILYVPLSKNGDPHRIVAAQSLQQVLCDLLRGLPRLGLLVETEQLLVTAQVMEKHRPASEGVITEFDRLFELGYQATVESLVAASADWISVEAPGSADNANHDAALIDCLQMITESLLKRWLSHSRSLRLSVLEKVSDKDRWERLKSFIESYGHDLFTGRFMNPGNLRALMHQGVDSYLTHLAQDHDRPDVHPLLDDLESGKLPRAVAVEQLSMVVEAILENFAEYKDFNSTTTQSDRGELLYMLLDFLRLKVSYERFAWNIKPVVMAHEILVRRDKVAAAELWRRAVAERTSEVADWHLTRLEELRKKYGLRLPTIADRLEERFVRPLGTDRLRALVQPSMEEVRRGDPAESFAILEQEIDDFAERPTGSGLDVPGWLMALEEEVAAVDGAPLSSENAKLLEMKIPHARLPLQEVQRQLREISEGR